MYLFNKCHYPGCNKNSISSIDEKGNLKETSDFCFEHTPNILEVKKKLNHFFRTHDKIVGLNASGFPIDNLNLDGKKLYGCNFQNCTFTNVHADNIRMRMCTFNFSTLTDCSILGSNIQFSSFSGSKLVHVLLTGSDLIHTNFNGITAYQSRFDDSDLYNSRFIKAVLMNTSMNNCNLKKTVFYESMREGVGFKLSNTRESLSDRNKGGLMGDFGAKVHDDDYSDNLEGGGTL